MDGRQGRFLRVDRMHGARVDRVCLELYDE
jgi:hypothetical protein